jgi:chemotaxis protein histidine kinase CheA
MSRKDEHAAIQTSLEAPVPTPGDSDVLPSETPAEAKIGKPARRRDPRKKITPKTPVAKAAKIVKIIRTARSMRTTKSAKTVIDDPFGLLGSLDLTSGGVESKLSSLLPLRGVVEAAVTKAQTDTTATAQTDATATAQTDATTTAQTDAVAKAQTDAVAKAQTDAAAKAQTDATAKAQTDAAAKAQTDAVAKAQVDAVAKAQTDAVARAQTDAVARAQTDAAPSAPHPLGGDGREVCSVCGGQMRRAMSNLEHTCLDCGLVVEGDTAEPEDDDAPRPPPNVARLRIVGPNSNLLQPDLYRSGSGNTAATQKKQILEEFKVYRQLYIEAGGRAFPLNALELAAEYYNAVQRQCVKRSQNKKSIMAACLHRACLEIRYAPAKAEVAAFMQLPSKGIARGDNFVRSLVADGKMEIDLNTDPSRPEIETLFANLGYEGDQYAGLREAVYNIVQKAIQNNIGTNSILRSKVYGATFAVLRRCRDRTLIPKPMSMQEFCQKRIRKNTIDRVVRELDDYHSFFEPVYKAAGLDSAPSRKH